MVESNGNGQSEGLLSYEEALTIFHDNAWVGVLGRYSAIVGRSALNWICGYSVLSARASRSLCFQHAYPHYGMEYALLLMRSGGGKSTAMRLAKAALAGQAVHFMEGAQSSQAIGEGLAQIEWSKEGPEVKAVYRTLLWEPEFARLLQSADMSGSSIIPELCRAYDADEGFTIRRVHKNGGTLHVPGHQLSILGATSEHAFTSQLSERHLYSGLLSRFLIFIVDGLPKEAEAPTFPWSSLGRFADTLPPLAFTVGDSDISVKEFYSPAAWDVYLQFHVATALYADEAHPLHLWFSRAQAHFHRISLLLMWADRLLQVPPEFATAAYTACFLWVASVFRITSAVPDLSPSANHQQEVTWSRKWLAQYLSDVPVSPRILQSRCLNLKDGKAKWPLVKAEVEYQIKLGTIEVVKDGKGRLWKLPDTLEV